jgi:hypothetical protein
MIVTVQKTLDEILGSLSPYTSVLIAGCDGCTQPPRGLREAEALGRLLELGTKSRGKKFDLKVTTLPKQCDSYLVADSLGQQTDDVEAILSLACGVGVQTLTQVLPDLITLPAQNTLFMGMEAREGGTFEENCAACGDCILALTGGICSIARCAKGLLNGACGGSSDDKCEQDPQKDCAWCLIYKRLQKLDRLDILREFHHPRNFRAVARPGRLKQ